MFILKLRNKENVDAQLANIPLWLEMNCINVSVTCIYVYTDIK